MGHGRRARGRIETGGDGPPFLLGTETSPGQRPAGRGSLGVDPSDAFPGPREWPGGREKGAGGLHEEVPRRKAPWIEGDLFSSLFEGFQTFTAKPAKIAGEKAEVPIEFVYTYQGEATRWTDTLLLKRSESGWLVDDVRYGATWDFANQGTLQEALKPEKPVE